MAKKSKKTNFTAVGALILAALFIIIYLVLRPGNDNSVVLDTEWIKGNPEADITLIEYSDFQCPACQQRVDIIKKLSNEFSRRVKIVYRHYPLTQHQHAFYASQASEAAGVQGKFWEMHDMIFDNQSLWSNMSSSEVEKEFFSYAKDLELDLEQFKDDIESRAVRKAVESDKDLGVEARVSGTPSFYLDGQPVTINSYEAGRQLIRNVINAKDAEVQTQ
jgi:protein-disulfide isomerase